MEPMQHKSKERATTELKDVPIGNCSHTETQRQTIMDSDDKSYQSEMSNTCILQIRTEWLIRIQRKSCFQSNTIEKKQ